MAICVVCAKSEFQVMASSYPLHTFALHFQLIAFALALGVGIFFMLQSDHLKLAISTAESMQESDDLDTSQIKMEEKDSLDRVYLMMRIVGAVALAAAIIIFWNALGLMTLLLGPASPLVRGCLCAEAVRDSLESEVVHIMKRQDREGFESRLAATYGMSRRMCTHDKRKGSLRDKNPPPA